MSLFSVNAIIILSVDDGSRIFAKYYDSPHHAPNASTASTNPYPDVKSQKAFEKGLLEKTAKQTGDIILCTSPDFLLHLPSCSLTGLLLSLRLTMHML